MSRLEQARAEIARRRALAERCAGSAIGWWEAPALAMHFEDLLIGEVLHPQQEGEADAALVAAYDPAHVLAVLAAADAALDRHAPESDVPLDEGVPWCRSCPDLIEGDGTHLTWPCPDAAAVLDLYAPEVRGG